MAEGVAVVAAEGEAASVALAAAAEDCNVVAQGVTAAAVAAAWAAVQVVAAEG